MESNVIIHRTGIASLIIFSCVLLATYACAQPSGRQGGGFPPPPGMDRDGPPMGPPRPITLLQVPMPILASELKLTGEQKSKIDLFRREFQQMQGRSRPPRGGRPGDPPPDHPGGGHGGPPPNGQGGDFGGPPPPPPAPRYVRGQDGPPPPDSVRGASRHMKEKETETLKKIEELLTVDQKTTLPGLMRILNSLRESGVPLPIYIELNLSSYQKNKIVQIAKSAREASRKRMDESDLSGDREAGRAIMDASRKQTREKVLKTLSVSQRNMIAKFEKERPRRGPDGLGRPGNPGGPPPREGGGPPLELNQ